MSCQQELIRNVIFFRLSVIEIGTFAMRKLALVSLPAKFDGAELIIAESCIY